MTPVMLSPGCKVIWDGTDFSECFRDRYLLNWPLALVISSILYLFTTYISNYLFTAPDNRVTSESLVSPEADADLSKLEADTIISSLASSVLPPHTGSTPEKPLPTIEAEEVVEEFKRSPDAGTARREKIGWAVGVVGAAVWLGVEVARGVMERSWTRGVFPASLLLFSFHPRHHIIPLLTLHLIPQLFLFRSSIINNRTTPLEIASFVIEAVWWSALISVPYGDPLDRLLDGARSKGGSTLGSYGKRLPTHPEEPTSAFSRATYTFILPMLFRHYLRPITLAEVPGVREDDSSAASIGAWRAHQAHKDEAWAKKHPGEKRKKNLAVEYIWFFLPELFLQCLWATIFILLMYVSPTGLRLLLQYVKKREIGQAPPTHVAYLYVAMMASSQIIGVMAMGMSLVFGRKLGIRLRAIIVAELFAKALRRRDTAGNVKKTQVGKDGATIDDPTDSSSSEGKIANHVSVDAFQISEICAYIFYVVSCPIAVVINTIMLYNTIGYASFAGMAILILMIPIQTLVAKLYTNTQKNLMSAIDSRLEIVTEVISHVKLIKFNAWEEKFIERIGVKRRHELKMLAKRFAVSTLFLVVVWGTPVMVTAGAFAVHVLVLKQELTADRAFSALILFTMLRDPLGLFQDTLTKLLQAYTSCQRIQAFLEEPDTAKYQLLTRPGPGDPQIGFKDAIVGYTAPENIDDEEFEPFSLGELDLSFPVGELSVVVGPVGCGKTTLIMALLGETNLLQGKVYMPDDHANREVCQVDPVTGLSDTIAYCAQTAWLVGATIRENIVFGSTWDKKRYNAVIKACALERDFEIFELGDETEVGEKGTTCSGGQKARIALARALYSPAKTVLLDDVLSAVDAQTARHLHRHCLLGPLMKGRTVIMVTHAISLVVPSAALVVMLQDGQVQASGTPHELVASGDIELHEEEADHDKDNESGSKLESSNDNDNTPTSSTLSPDEDPVDIIEDQLDGLDGDALETQKQVKADQAAPEAVRLANKLVETESQGQGMIGLSTYLLYCRSVGGVFFWVVLATAFCGSQLLQVASNAWIKEWANSNDRREANTLGFMIASTSATITETGLTKMQLGVQYLASRSTEFYLIGYVVISAAFMLSIAARFGLGYMGSLRASHRLWNRLLKRILGARMRFFDSTPSSLYISRFGEAAFKEIVTDRRGRIINRLSKDMSSIDTEAGEILMYFTQTLLSVTAVLGVVTFSTPAFLIPLAFIAIMYWIVGSLYVATSRELKRMDSTTRSPIFISFSEALVGMSTIRSYGDSARFLRKIFHELDQNTRCFWYLWQANRVLNNFSNFVGSLVTIFACIFAIENKSLNAGAVGFSVTYALSFSEFVLWVVRLYAAAEMSMNSVERVGEYLELEVEEEDQHRGIEPPAYWPSRDGTVVVDNLTCHYAPQLEPVLRGVSFEIGPKEKIGICGRTGSGKSTLALSFFRFLHQSAGSIIIDGQDISRLSLTSLRDRLTILPQEAQLFSGTVRDNLDPFNQHEDYDVWEALRQCGLASKNANTPSGSRAPSRVGSRRNLREAGSKRDLKRVASKKALAAQSRERLGVEGTFGQNGDGEESINEDGVASADEWEEEEERVTIRSLEEKVAVGGKNFSQGQRQLLALARGLLKLRSSSFLIMDESTANLDHATDQTIQNVLRTGLADIQMLVIAHRLMTVCGLDKILVLDHGKVVEFGTPWELMQANGMFRDLCKQSGEEALLLEVAKGVHDARRAASTA